MGLEILWFGRGERCEFRKRENEASFGSMDGSSRYTGEGEGKRCTTLDGDSMDFDLVYALENFMDAIPAFDLRRVKRIWNKVK